MRGGVCSAAPDRGVHGTAQGPNQSVDRAVLLALAARDDAYLYAWARSCVRVDDRLSCVLLLYTGRRSVPGRDSETTAGQSPDHVHAAGSAWAKPGRLDDPLGIDQNRETVRTRSGSAALPHAPTTYPRIREICISAVHVCTGCWMHAVRVVPAVRPDSDLGPVPEPVVSGQRTWAQELGLAKRASYCPVLRMYGTGEPGSR